MDYVHGCGKHRLTFRSAEGSSSTPVLRSGPLAEPQGTIGNGHAEYPRNRTVAGLFTEVAAKYPENIALAFGKSQLTYSQLNARANRLGHHLRRMGVRPGTLVGCCLERSPESVIALLAILKAGAAYVPLDPSYPKDRLNFLLKDTQAPLVLSQRTLAASVLAGQNLPLILLDDQLPIAADDNSSLESSCEPTALAYVMYTSGSTGIPKGVMVTNRAIIRLVRNTSYCRFAPDEVFLQLAPISFDASTFEIWGPLLNGGRLAIMPPEFPSLEDIGRAIRTYGVTTLWLTSGLFHLMVEQRLDDLKPLRQLLAGGDVLSPRHVRTCLERLPHTTLINGYGPTENTTFTCCHVLRPGDPVPDSIPIGRPISHTQVFILDSQMRPVAPGEQGEICISGDGLALGYLNRPEETAEKFLANPFGQDSRLYRSGDLGRWLPDGSIQFLGRIDNQFKILGHRVDIEEVEAAFQSCVDVQQICVVPKERPNRSKIVVAFYVPSRNSDITQSGLRAFAAQKLPDYMIPSHFVRLDSMPLSPNGKLDRQALATIEIISADGQTSSQNCVEPIEATLRELWQRVLAAPSIGLDDNFFDVGGDSLLLINLHSQLEKALAIRVSLTDLFQFTTIRSLARHLKDQQHSSSVTLNPARHQALNQRRAFAQWRAPQSSEMT